MTWPNQLVLGSKCFHFFPTWPSVSLLLTIISNSGTSVPPVGVSVQPDLPFKRHRCYDLVVFWYYTHQTPLRSGIHTWVHIHAHVPKHPFLQALLAKIAQNAVFLRQKPQFDAVKPQHTLREMSILAYKVSLASKSTWETTEFQAAMEFTSKDVRCICT